MNQRDFAIAILKGLSINQTNDNISAIIAWENAEGGNWNNTATFNPLNTTQRMPGSTSMNGVGVQAYTSWDEGIQATIKTLLNGNYGNIISAMNGGSAQEIANAVVSSPWGTKNINIGNQNISSTDTGGSTSGSAASGGQPAAAKIDAATLAEEYGFTSDFLNANPELKKIFQQAVSGQWSTDKFKATLMTTNWWKTHSDTERQYLTQTFTDPASAKQTYATAQNHARQLMHSIGVNVDGKTWNQVLSTLSYDIAAKGWTDDQVKMFAGQYANLLGGKMYGDAETQYSNGLQYAYSMGVKMSDSWYQQQVKNIEMGTATFADLQQGIRNQAKAQYSQFAQQIDGGQTIQDLASPYIQQMGSILEVNPQTLSAFDPTIKAALSYKDPRTGQAGSQPLWQFENSLRQDPRWLATNNARDSMMTVAHGVLQQMGMTF